MTWYPIKFRLCLRGIWLDVMRVCASEKYATKKNLYRYKRQIVGLICHIVFHFFGNFMPYPVFQDCFEMAARTPMKISSKIKEKNSGLIAGAPKKIHRQKQNISEKNIKK